MESYKARAEIKKYKLEIMPENYEEFFNIENPSLANQGFTIFEKCHSEHRFWDVYLFHDMGASYIIDLEGNIAIICIPENHEKAKRNLEEYLGVGLGEIVE